MPSSLHSTTGFELDASLVYIETTIPAGTTIDAYRRSRPASPSLLRRLLSSRRKR